MIIRARFMVHALIGLLMANSAVQAQTVFPTSLVSYWNFDESSSGTGMALDQVDGNDGTFVGTAVRASGLIGNGAALLNNVNSDGVNVGAGSGNNFSVTTGVTVEALIRPGWSGTFLDFDDIFRKSDASNRILLAFQNDGSSGSANPPVAAGPALSFGLNVGGTYSELDMPLDGAAGRPTLAGLKDGNTHHVVATYDSGTGLKAIYIDGTLRFSTNLGGGNLVTSGGGGGAFIGSRSTATEPFTGVIDEVAFYNDALPAGEISNHFNNFLAGRGFFFFQATPVPTLSEWSAICLFFLLAFATWKRLRKPKIIQII